MGDFCLLHGEYQLELWRQILIEFLSQCLCLCFPSVTKDHEVSRPGESHPQALSEPDVNVSAHPAPITQSWV